MDKSEQSPPRGVVTLAPATRDDFAELAARSEFTPRTPPVRVLALAAKVDGRVIGIGGVAFYGNGQKVAFADISEEARGYPVSIHKAGRATLALAKKHGLTQLVATGDSHDASKRWLERLGFRPVEIGGRINHVLEL